MDNLDGKTALVTGAAGGIGQAIVAALRHRGVSVAATDVQACDGDHVILGDLMDPSFCDSLPQRAADRLGQLDILVNNAGIITRGKITEATDNDFARSMAINVEAPFRLCRAAIPIMALRGRGPSSTWPRAGVCTRGRTIRSM